MEIQRLFFKLIVFSLLLVAVYFQTSLQQQQLNSNNCNYGEMFCNVSSIASAPGVSFAPVAPGVSFALDQGSSLAPAPSFDPQQPLLAPEDVSAVQELLKGVANNIRYKAPDRTACSDTYWSPNFIVCDCSFQDNKICRVTHLYLANEKIEGVIPEAIGNLSYLRYLDLSQNMLHGTIPRSISKLSKLQELTLFQNMLEGTIPESFWNLSKLTKIDLMSNKLNGGIPSVLHKMESLEFIDLSHNFFNGRIPSHLGSLRFLEFLYLDNNLLSGEIPKELKNIVSLSELSLAINMLGGKIPDELGNLGNLSVLDLANNQFIGTLSASFQNWKKISYLDVHGNNLGGKLLDVVFSWKQIEYLVLFGNPFEASLPTDKFQSLKKVNYLYISDLVKVEDEDSQFPDLSNLTSLKFLMLRNCSLSGPIPPVIWTLKFTFLDLSFNSLTGGIPASVIHENLDYLFLRSNKLNGPLPKWLTNKIVQNVDLSENNFTEIKIPTDTLPPNINIFACCQSSNISNRNREWLRDAHYCPNDTMRMDSLYINCGGPRVDSSGSSYDADMNPEGESTFTLSDNKRWGYSSMGYQDLSIFNKTCNLTMDHSRLYQTARLATISLKYYGFCLKRNTYIVRLHFAEICRDEDQVSGFKSKRVFDVMIKGTNTSNLYNFDMEAEAGGVNLNVTREFTVHVNDTLEIHLYWSGKGSDFLRAPDIGPLISAISVSPVPKKKHKKLPAAAIAGIAVSATSSIVFVLVLFWWLGWFGGKKQQDPELKGIELYPGGYFSYRQIRAATRNFDASNKLGEGGFGAVYKGILPNGNEIAVKQLSAKSRQGIREFVNEIGTISALQHPNLVRLMGCCVEDNQLLLIYENMKNNSLDHAFFGPDQDIKLRMNWQTRVKICLGIAKGLAFLHEESKLKIIHRDIKLTNILLDEDLNAKISDFGFAKLFEEEKTHVITRIAGTTGYMAPEYAMRGHLTTKADVYSFGVVTLEIVSGKNSASYRPNDQTVFLLDLAYVLQEQGNLLALVDPDLKSEYNWKEASTILELAMLCTNPSPTLRPTMSEVVKILEGKNPIKTTSAGVPYSTDNFTVAKAVAALSQSTQSGSDSQGGASSTTISQSVNKEIEESSSFSADNSGKAAIEQDQKFEN